MKLLNHGISALGMDDVMQLQHIFLVLTLLFVVRACFFVDVYIFRISEIRLYLVDGYFHIITRVSDLFSRNDVYHDAGELVCKSLNRLLSKV